MKVRRLIVLVAFALCASLLIPSTAFAAKGGNQGGGGGNCNLPDSDAVSLEILSN